MPNSKKSGALTTVEAAAYLGVSPRYMRYLIYEVEEVKPDDRRGFKLLFDRSTIDRLKKRLPLTRRKKGSRHAAYE